MSTLRMPLLQNTRTYELRVDNLDGVVFRFNFRFNNRSGFWQFDLLTDDNVRIKSGVKVVLGTAMLRLVTDINRPPGEILLIDTTDSGKEAGLNDLGNDAVLVYEEAASLLAAVS